MHQTSRGTEPCGLEDGHRGHHRTVAGAEREARRRHSPEYRETVARYDAQRPAQAYLRKSRWARLHRGVA